MLNKEIWKDVVGYEEFYSVSSLGRVMLKSKIIKHMNTNKHRLIKSKMMSLRVNRGYVIVGFRSGTPTNKQVIKKVHRLVAEAFIPNPENKPQVNHINGNKSDNRVENLEWNTSFENQKHRYTHLGQKGTWVNRSHSEETKKKLREKRLVLNNSQIEEIKELLKTGITHDQIAKQFNVSRTVVTRINLSKY